MKSNIYDDILSKLENQIKQKVADINKEKELYRFKGKWTDLRNSQVKVSGYNNP